MPEKPVSDETEKKVRGSEQSEIENNISREARDLELAGREALFRGLFENMTSCSAIYDVVNDGSKGADYIVKGFNNNSLKMEGKTLDQVMGKSLFDLRPEIDSYGVTPTMKKVWETGKPAFQPVELYRDNVLVNYYENYIFKVPTGEIVTIYSDAVDRKKAEIEMKERLERLELAMRFAGAGVFDWNLETDEIYLSPGWKNMLGYDDSEIKNELSEWERLASPEDLKASRDMLDEVIAGKRDRFERTFKMLHKDGHWIDVLSRANVVFDETGKAVRFLERDETLVGESLTMKEIRDYGLKKYSSIIRRRNCERFPT